MTIRSACLAGLVVVSAGTVAFGQTARINARPGAATMTLRQQSDSPALDLLQKRVEQVDWSDSTLEEVIEWLRTEAEGNQVNIIPKWNSLAEEGVTRDSLVTLQLRNVTVGMVLNEVLDLVSETRQASYRAVGNILRISTKRDFGRDMEVRVYDILDLVFYIPDFGRNAPTIDLNAASRQSSSGGGGGGSGQSVFGGGTSSSSQDLEQEETELDERLTEVRDAIVKMIEPETWIENGGQGEVQIFNQRQIIVRNTIEVHEKIAGYFSYNR
ncbi:MAG: hypothetical protein J5J06_00680 [Phycisphaerae bacterium]|nr:hypothetical protein [Phycisphaerae bacterium]